jgi:hypothetical protein
LALLQAFPTAQLAIQVYWYVLTHA